MSILRAAFWLGVMAFLMPHEPNLGLGRPGTLYDVHANRQDGAADRVWDAVAARLSQLRAEFAERDR